jgi:methylated-DNA-[protein]-cysteine S-methyltransferase
VAEFSKTYYNSPIGIIEITGNDLGIYSLSFLDNTVPDNGGIPNCLKDCRNQLDEYFKGKRKSFSLNYIIEGTPFQKKVWNSLMEIPYGETISYARLAEMAGNKKAVRAVGGANGKNRLPILLPCHRVIGSDGSLTGFASGLWRKKWLLEHEIRLKDER